MKGKKRQRKKQEHKKAIKDKWSKNKKRKKVVDRTEEKEVKTK